MEARSWLCGAWVITGMHCSGWTCLSFIFTDLQWILNFIWMYIYKHVYMRDRHFNITAHWSVKSFACENACIKKLQPESKWQMYTNSMYIQEARCPKSAQKCHTVWRELVRDWKTPVGILQLQNTVFACFHCWFLMSDPTKWHRAFFSFLIVAILWMKMKTKGVHFLHRIFFFFLQLKMKSSWKRSETTHFWRFSCHNSVKYKLSCCYDCITQLKLSWLLYTAEDVQPEG